MINFPHKQKSEILSKALPANAGRLIMGIVNLALAAVAFVMIGMSAVKVQFEKNWLAFAGLSFIVSGLLLIIFAGIVSGKAESLRNIQSDEPGYENAYDALEQKTITAKLWTRLAYTLMGLTIFATGGVLAGYIS